MGDRIKFCFVCGSKLKMMYPAGDPENGPAEMLCISGHKTVRDIQLESIWDLTDEKLFDMLIESLGTTKGCALSDDVADLADSLRPLVNDLRKKFNELYEKDLAEQNEKYREEEKLQDEKYDEYLLSLPRC